MDVCHASRRRHLITGTLAIAAATLVVSLAACGGGTRSDAARPAPAVAGAPVEIAVIVNGGRVTPATERVDVARGSTVRITVATDIADEVHVHGYDVRKELPARGAATLEFVADQAGLFEVETHRSGVVICQLVVR
ncbi:hypothetical protein O7626_03635 [Micromonospora sp. WMMD1102]|uniref:hypothetical protein n=1 Tax=Micromonospora sp. WMMD1102 TaxID=3016105 RepID=UPI00241560AD|nr:hypothetical protein [Micromonospora sp. WMMD1102]MDG4785032.1 hypothetical protein [Micromonospora sp. WMMD1102]